MTGDELKSLTTSALDSLAFALDDRHSEALTHAEDNGALSPIQPAQRLANRRAAADGDARRRLSRMDEDEPFSAPR